MRLTLQDLSDDLERILGAIQKVPPAIDSIDRLPSITDVLKLLERALELILGILPWSRRCPLTL